MGGSGNIKSSNSQLFKGSEGSGAAIPLTFNNSIAEVLAAAAGKTKLNKSREPSPKPEITITAKNSKIGSNTSIEALKITKKNSGNTVGNLGKLFFTAHWWFLNCFKRYFYWVYMYIVQYMKYQSL